MRSFPQTPAHGIARVACVLPRRCFERRYRSRVATVSTAYSIDDVGTPRGAGVLSRGQRSVAPERTTATDTDTPVDWMVATYWVVQMLC